MGNMDTTHTLVEANIKQALRELPKAHLHLHLFGSCPRSLWDQVSGDDPVWRANTRGDHLIGFDSFYARCKSTIRDRIPMRDLVLGIAQQSVEEGCRWVELSISVTGRSAEYVHDTMSSVDEASRRTGLAIGVVFSIGRSDSEEQIASALRHYETYKPYGAVGIGVVGPESPGQLARLTDMILRADLDPEMLIVPHAGEVNGSEDVYDALQMGPQRIAHGIGAVDNEMMIQMLVNADVCLDVAISSNECMGTVSPGEHPLPRLLEAGVPCTINSDDGLLFGTDLVNEYVKASQLGVSMDQLARCARWSVEYSAAPDHIRASTLEEISAWEHRWLDQEGAAPLAVGAVSSR